MEQAVYERSARGAAAAPPSYRSPYLAAALMTLAVWLLYAFTLSPTTWFWDTSEYIATAHIVGIPHPPGNPLFVLLARAWELLLAPFGLSAAVRVNLFSATMSALAHGCWFLLAHRVLAAISPSTRIRLVGAAASTLVSATAFTVWNQSNVNEKVYTVSLFTIALLSWLVFRWRDHVGEGKDDNLILLMIFILALSVGNHLMAFLAAPAIVLYILMVNARSLANWRLYALGVPAIVLGLSVHLFLPIRAGLDPVINEADPSCPTLASAVQSVLTLGGSGCDNLSAALQREQYDKPSMFSNPVAAGMGQPDVPRDAALLAAQTGNYLQYFDWQWARSVGGLQNWFGGARPLFTLLFIGLGLYGAARHYRADRPSWAYVAVLFVTLSFGLMFYLNFRYGYTYPSDASMEMREVRERDYFFIVGFSVWGVWAGIGIAALWQRLATRLQDRGRTASAAELATAPILLLALIPLLFNWSWASRRHDYSARDWAYNLLMSVEPYGILFTNGDNDTFPLWYLQEVEGIRRDVTVMVMSYLNTPWYVEQIKGLTTPCAPGQDPLADPTVISCQRPFQPERAAGLYQAWVTPGQGDTSAIRVDEPPAGTGPPTESIMPLDLAQIRDVAGTPPYQLRESLVYRAGNIETVLPAGSWMLPSRVFLAAMVTTAIDDRPVYFAMTTQAYDDLGLRPYLIRQGLAFKLNNGPVQEDPARGIYQVPNDGSGLVNMIGPYIDLPRTEQLLDEVFMHRGGFPDEWGHWADRATTGIPNYYGIAHYGAALVHTVLGDSVAANRHLDRGAAYINLATGGDR